MSTDDLFSKFSPGSFEVQRATGESVSVTFGIVSIGEGFSSRVIRRTRQYVDGERLDNTGANAREWTLTVVFHPGGEDNQAPNAYPDDADAFAEALRITRTGWLSLPTTGRVRAQCASYQRQETCEVRDHAAFTAVFVEDSEDDERVASFKQPPAASAAPSLTVAMLGAADVEAGLNVDPFQQIQQLAAELQSYAQTPERFLSSWESRTRTVVRSIIETGRTFAQAPAATVSGVLSLLSSPETASTQRKARSLADTLGRSVSSARTFQSYVLPSRASIFDVATELQQDADALIGLNASIPDLLEMPAGTKVRYYAGAR